MNRLRSIESNQPTLSSQGCHGSPDVEGCGDGAAVGVLPAGVEDVLVQPLVQIVHAVVEGEDHQLRGAGGSQVTWGGVSHIVDDVYEIDFASKELH